jgi:uncharacterized cupin superfamily protein
MKNKYLIANELVKIIWPLIVKYKFFQSRKLYLFNSAINPIPLVLAATEDFNFNSSVAVFDGDGGDFQRFDSIKSIPDIETNKRTRIYESIHLNSNEWPSFSTSQFSRLSRRRIVCGLYVSNYGDKGIGLHKDEWDGIIIQTSGAKNWVIYDDECIEHQITLNAGDVLFLPQGFNHDVNTNLHSEHLVFAFLNTLITSKTPLNLPKPPHFVSV